MGILALGLLVAASGDLILNEILYDPPGGDSGYEFVELLNPTERTLSLEGVSLQFVNGGDGVAKELWRGPGRELAPGERWLLGESELPEADETIVLGLQNGPDALWLLRDAARIDAVAWGDVAGLGEGESAPDLSGVALARIPDGTDLDDNRGDFRAADPPTPGEPNSHASQFELIAAAAEPKWLEVAGLQHWTLALRARGDDPLQIADLLLLLDEVELHREILHAVRAETLQVEFALELPIGRHRLEVRSEGPGGWQWARWLSVGRDDLAFHELLPRPQSGGSEWVELLCPSIERCAGRGFGFADRSLQVRSFTLPENLEARLLLLAEDCHGVSTLSPSTPCIELVGWPSLNDHGVAAEPADELHLYDDAGVLIDWLAYGAGVVIGRGESLEAVQQGDERLWFVSPAAPTPGRVNSTQGPPPRSVELDLQPNPWIDSAGLLHVQLRAESEESRAEAQVLDLRGRLVRALGSARQSGVQRLWIWDGRDEGGRPVEAGAYVVVVRVERPDGGISIQRALLAMGAKP